MLKIDKEKILNEPTIRKVQFDNDTYFSVDDLARFLNEDLSDVETINLPIGGNYIKTATIETVEKGRKEEPLSKFNEALLKMRNPKNN